MERAFGWYLGDNHLGMPLADPDDGSCRDGLGPDGVNGNMGAESTLAGWSRSNGCAPSPTSRRHNPPS